MKLPQSLYIGGEWANPQSAAVEPIINPATEEPIGLAPIGGLREMDAAIAAARQAFDAGPWPTLSGRERATKLQTFYDALVRRREEICHLIRIEAGATQANVNALQFGVAMKHAQFFIDICTRDPAESLPTVLTPNAAGGKTLGAGVMVREPVGVVAAITPFNFPFFLNVSKVFPALAAGCTVVLKPSPFTPFEGLLLGWAADEAGLPKGVLNIVTGGKEAGEKLTTDPRVDLVTFTGSDTVGAAIQAQTAPTLKRVLLELGGKSALIVRADADLPRAAAAGLMGFTLHCGQGCTLQTRQLVHNSVRAEYVKLLTNLAKAVKIGDPADPTVTMGPLIRDSQRRRTEEYVAVALAQGGRLVTGGKRPKDLVKGFFYEPTLFDDVDNRSRIAQEEVFGPVGVVIGFDTDEEAISKANDSAFGLAGGIFSADVGRAFEMARQIRTGGVSINGGAGTMNSYAPFGGIKRSGYGREYGYEGLNEFTYIKSIAFHGG
jgi:aldehyde dehydrogenase (NAD+)